MKYGTFFALVQVVIQSSLTSRHRFICGRLTIRTLALEMSRVDPPDLRSG